MAAFFGGASRILSALQARPVLFNGATGCSLFGVSDVIAQGLEKDAFSSSSNDEWSKVVERRRMISAAFIGFMACGFVYPYAYSKLDKIWAGANFSSVVKKSFLEIATVGIFVNSVSIACRGLLVGRNGEEVTVHVASEIPNVTLNDARVWLPYNMVAFSVIPVHIRPATTSLMEAMWQTYISLCSHNYVETESDES